MAITSRVFKLELEMGRLRQKTYERDRVILDPRSAAGSPQEISSTISPMKSQYEGRIICLHATHQASTKPSYTEEQLRQLFRMFDRDGNGYITAELAHSMAEAWTCLDSRGAYKDEQGGFC
ncbi:hypothetical protein F0562_007441 [Nyssa sinensis]|uniref:EF-hand domain-containing protein n=1 Tax=Nyssa sinensis TaxID=561372 RepID=A0A5J5A6M1_9ASTE|nr:hypothetical protein F0562_007441 [Nyssa sinensis]